MAPLRAQTSKPASTPRPLERTATLDATKLPPPPKYTYVGRVAVQLKRPKYSIFNEYRRSPLTRYIKRPPLDSARVKRRMQLAGSDTPKVTPRKDDHISTEEKDIIEDLGKPKTALAYPDNNPTGHREDVQMACKDVASSPATLSRRDPGVVKLRKPGDDVIERPRPPDFKPCNERRIPRTALNSKSIQPWLTKSLKGPSMDEELHSSIERIRQHYWKPHTHRLPRLHHVRVRVGRGTTPVPLQRRPIPRHPEYAIPPALLSSATAASDSTTTEAPPTQGTPADALRMFHETLVKDSEVPERIRKRIKTARTELHKQPIFDARAKYRMLQAAAEKVGWAAVGCGAQAKHRTCGHRQCRPGYEFRGPSRNRASKSSGDASCRHKHKHRSKSVHAGGGQPVFSVATAPPSKTAVSGSGGDGSAGKSVGGGNELDLALAVSVLENSSSLDSADK